MDKSAIQALSRHEMEAIAFSDLYLNVPPILLREVLGNVAKVFADKRDASSMVRTLAEKVGGFHSTINVDYRDACTVELTGMARIPIDECGILAADARFGRGHDGQSGMIIDQRRWQSIVEKWKRGTFSEEDLHWASQWRAATQSFRKSELFQRLERNRIVLPRAQTVDDCYATVDDLLSRATLQAVWLDYVVGELRLGARAQNAIRQRWAVEGGWLQAFAPYAYFCLRAMLAVASASRFGLIKWEPTTVLDATYLYYVPFCEIFISNDHVHERLAPRLLNPHQRFVTARMIKPEIRPIVEEWKERRGIVSTGGAPR